MSVAFEPVGIVGDAEGVRARATRVGVTASATVHASDGTEENLGTATEHYVIATGSSPTEEEHAREAGVVRAARGVGEALVRRLFGEPVPTPGR